MISFVESCKRIPTLDTVGKLAFALGTSATELVTEAEKRAQ